MYYLRRTEAPKCTALCGFNSNCRKEDDTKKVREKCNSSSSICMALYELHAFANFRWKRFLISQGFSWTCSGCQNLQEFLTGVGQNIYHVYVYRLRQYGIIHMMSYKGTHQFKLFVAKWYTNQEIIPNSEDLGCKVKTTQWYKCDDWKFIFDMGRQSMDISQCITEL